MVSVLISAIAAAGTVSPLPVTVKLNPDGSGFATGSMSTARFSPNVSEWIGCGEAGYRGQIRDGWCGARTQAAVEGNCYIDDVKLLDVIHGITSYSVITFRWNADGVCTSVQIVTASSRIP